MIKQQSLFMSIIYILIATGCGGGGDNEPFDPSSPSHALIFSFPMNDMKDVPLGSKGLFVFSGKVEQEEVTSGCSAGEGEDMEPQGAFCITGPDGLVNTAENVTVVNQGRTIQFDMNVLAPGANYRVWIKPSASPSAENVKDNGEPLLEFRTRQKDPIPGSSPSVVAVNQEDPNVFVEGSEAEPKFPFMDFTPIRITFSEPLEQDSVQAGDSVKLVRVAEDDSTEAVEFSLHANNHYMTLQPDEDLTPDERYEVRLDDSISDLNGDDLASTTYVFVPNSSKENPGDANPPVDQTLETWPAMGDPGYPKQSALTDLPLNEFTLTNEALGENTAYTLEKSLQAYLANPPDYPGATPLVMRAGQSLQLTGINPAKLGGEVHTDLDTGTITGTFITDVSGYLTPNPYRPEGFQPDDERAPLYVYMDFDMAMQTENDAGNASLNQNLMHARAVGIATVEAGNLVLEAFRTLAFEVLGGATTLSADFSLSARSNPDANIDTSNSQPPMVTGSFPRENDTGVDIDEDILLTLNEPVSRKGLNQIQLTGNGVPEPIDVTRQGTSLVIAPEDGQLEPDTEYTLSLSSEITDRHLFNPIPIEFQRSDATDGDGNITFTTANYARTDSNGNVAPIALGVYPGIGCALTDTDAEEGKAGRCVGGEADDALYNNFRYEIGRPIEITFSQPMDPDSMRIGEINAAGDACNNGAVCVAHNDEGTWETIELPLTVRNRAAQLDAPHGSFVPGDQYRLVLNGSGTTFRSHDILGNLQLNTTPIDSVENRGDRNIVIDFTATEPVDSVYATVRTRPYTDTNGNGYWDPGEVEQATNGARAIISDTGGLITQAQFADPQRDTIFVSAGLPMAFLPKTELDLSVRNLGMEEQGNGDWCVPEPDAQGEVFCMETEGEYMIPVEINPQVVLGTSLTLTATGGVGPFGINLDLETGSPLLRFQPREEPPMRGYVVNRPEMEKPYFIVKLDAWLDAPDLSLFGLENLGLAGHTLHSVPVRAYLGGPISFLDDGRITLEASNVNAITQSVGVQLLPNAGGGLEAGSVELLLEPGSFAIQVKNLPAKARRTAEQTQ